ncbi:MAG: hypothetical protein GXP01_02890 [Alphaproteobacteria bacterium]|nr:hypothetical protein [Alphaproteobacteria bacterium]
MIILIVTGGHRRTHKIVATRIGAGAFKIVSYDWLFRQANLPLATYIFTDFDRLGFWECEVAARVFRALRDGGATVLNDPAMALQRAPLLKRLTLAGVNSFQVWRPADGERPDRFPVFLRGQSGHRGPLSDLLHSLEEVEKTISGLIGGGRAVLHDLLVVEYCAAPISNGRFVKHAAYRVGDVICPALSLTGSSWPAKAGQSGLATDAEYEAQLSAVRKMEHVDEILAVFKIANIAYGRVDFTILNGRLEFYEINTNPTLRQVTTHRSELRVESSRLIMDKYIEALLALDVTSSGTIAIEVAGQSKRARRDNFWRRSRRGA